MPKDALAKPAGSGRDDAPFAFVVERDAGGRPAAEGFVGPAGREGPWRFRHPDGALWLAGSYRAGERVGRWSAFHAAGGLQSDGQYLAGRKHGPWCFWHENGRRAQFGSYRLGLQHGPWQTFRADGSLRFEQSLEQGRREGPLRLFDEHGQLLREVAADPPGAAREPAAAIEARFQRSRSASDPSPARPGELTTAGPAARSLTPDVDPSARSGLPDPA